MLVAYLAGLEFFLAKIRQYNCKFLVVTKTKVINKPGVREEIARSLGGIVERIQNALAKPDLMWATIWTNHLDKTTRKRLETESSCLLEAIHWFGSRSIISAQENDDAKNSGDTLIELFDGIQETLEKGEGWAI